MPKYRHSWEYPDCPNCETEILVRNLKGNSYKVFGEHVFRCEGCNKIFGTNNKDKAKGKYNSINTEFRASNYNKHE